MFLRRMVERISRKKDTTRYRQHALAQYHIKIFPHLCGLVFRARATDKRQGNGLLPHPASCTGDIHQSQHRSGAGKWSLCRSPFRPAAPWYHYWLITDQTQSTIHIFSLILVGSGHCIKSSTCWPCIHHIHNLQCQAFRRPSAGLAAPYALMLSEFLLLIITVGRNCHMTDFGEGVWQCGN